MDRGFHKGFLEIDFPTEPFAAPLPVLLRAFRLYLSNFTWIAALTLAVFLPGKLLLQFICEVTDVPPGGMLSYALLEISDLVLSALVVPALVYGLISVMRTGRAPAMAECLRWGRRQYAKTLWNKIKVEITIMLWGALLVIPGIIATIRLVFTDIVVAVEADLETDPMARSRELTRGRRWRVFLVLAPMMLLDLAATFLILDRIPGATDSRLLFAAADATLNVLAQLTTVAALLMYLGLLPPAKKVAPPRS
jgi:hypothetical protein